jgi:hypothetical protein
MIMTATAGTMPAGTIPAAAAGCGDWGLWQRLRLDKQQALLDHTGEGCRAGPGVVQVALLHANDNNKLSQQLLRM